MTILTWAPLKFIKVTKLDEGNKGKHSVSVSLKFFLKFFDMFIDRIFNDISNYYC